MFWFGLRLAWLFKSRFDSRSPWHSPAVDDAALTAKTTLALQERWPVVLEKLVTECNEQLDKKKVLNMEAGGFALASLVGADNEFVEKLANSKSTKHDGQLIAFSKIVLLLENRSTSQAAGVA